MSQQALFWNNHEHILPRSAVICSCFVYSPRGSSLPGAINSQVKIFTSNQLQIWLLRNQGCCGGLCQMAAPPWEKHSHSLLQMNQCHGLQACPRIHQQGGDQQPHAAWGPWVNPTGGGGDGSSSAPGHPGLRAGCHPGSGKAEISPAQTSEVLEKALLWCTEHREVLFSAL